MLPFHRYKFSTTGCIAHLGVELDSNLSLKGHIRNVAKGCFYKLQNTFKTRRCITDDYAQAMVHSIIISKLRYCNAIYFFIYFFYRLPVCILDSLLSVHRTVARLITGSRKYDHITGVMRKLHWLPVRERIQFKFLLLTFKCIHVMV